MSNLWEQVKATVMPIVGLVIFVAILIVAVIFLSYVFIFVAIVGLVLFTVGYIRARILMRKQAKQQPQKHKGRTIDHE